MGVPKRGILGPETPDFRVPVTLARILGVFRAAAGLLINVFFGQVLVWFLCAARCGKCARAGVCAGVRGCARGCARVCAGACAGVRGCGSEYLG